MENITEEMIQSIYERAISYSSIASGMGTPDEIRIHEYGTLSAIYLPYDRDYDTETFYFDASDLSKDLDEVTKQRAIDSENKRIKDEIESKRLKKEFEIKEKDKRLKEYNKLKKEFDSDMI